MRTLHLPVWEQILIHGGVRRYRWVNHQIGTPRDNILFELYLCLILD